MSGPKIVILVLVILAVIFAVTVAVGSWPGRDRKFSQSDPKSDEKFDPKDTWFFRALDTTFPSKSLDQKRIVSTCLSEGVFTIPESPPMCEVHIRGGKKGSIRDLELKVLQGTVKLKYEPSREDKNALRIKDWKLIEDKSIKLQILENGGKLTLANAGQPSRRCRIKIEK